MTQSLVRSDHDQSFDSLRKVIYDLQAATDLNTLSEVVSSYVHTHLGYELVWVGLYDSGSETLEGPWRHSSEPKAAQELLSILPGDLFDQVLLTRRTATVPSLQDEGRVGAWQHRAKKLKIQGAVLQTIRYQRESLGLLLIGTSKWGINPRQEESEQFAILANTVGATLKFLKSTAVLPATSLSTPINPEQSFKNLLQTLSQCESWDKQLTTIVQELVQTYPEGTSGLYLLDPDSGDFVTYHIHTGEEKRAYRSKSRTHTLNFHQNLSFFKTLERQQSLGISDVGSSFGISVPASLVTFLKVRACLLQAIVMGGTLKGFFVVGYSEPNNWTDSDKETLMSLSHFLTLTYPDTAATDQSADLSREFASRLNTCILPSPLSDTDDWDKGLNNWFHALTKQFQCQWSLLLTYDSDSQCYLPTQYFSANRRSGLDSAVLFSALSQVDEKLLTRNESAIAFNDLKDDLRFVAWHDVLLSHNIQSMLVHRVCQGSSLREVLLLGNATVRAWSSDDANDLADLVMKFRQARQRRHVHLEMLQEKRLNEVFRQGVQLLQTSKSSQMFVEEAAKILVDLFEVNSCGILLWPPQRDYAKVKALITSDPNQFSASVGARVELGDDLIQCLIEPAKARDAILKPVSVLASDLSDQSRSWLCAQEHWSIVGLPLQPQPQQSIFGVLFLAHPSQLSLTAREMETLSDFARQIAWMLFTSHIKDAWRKDYESLHTTHWYQHKVNEAEADRMIELMPPLDLTMEPLTLVRLLRELLDQLEPVFATRQIWVQVHHVKQSNLALNSSKPHLVLVLDELLKAATVRSEMGGRIDIWCQINNPGWLDLSITDSGSLPRRFIRDLQLGHHRNRLRASAITNDLGHRLLACKSVTELLGGKLNFQSLEDGRTLTCLTLPCITP